MYSPSRGRILLAALAIATALFLSCAAASDGSHERESDAVMLAMPSATSNAVVALTTNRRMLSLEAYVPEHTYHGRALADRDDHDDHDRHDRDDDDDDNHRDHDRRRHHKRYWWNRWFNRYHRRHNGRYYWG